MTQDVNTATEQDKTGKDDVNALDVVKLKEAHDALLADRDKLAIEIRGLRSSAGDASKLEKQLDTLLTEKSTLMATIETMKAETRDKELTSHLQTALEAAGAKAATTAMKLIDRAAIEFDKNGQVVQESIAKAIAAVKESDPILFGDKEPAVEKKGELPVTPPGIQRAAPGSGGKSDYESELAAARQVKDGGKAITEVLRKYGKI